MAITNLWGELPKLLDVTPPIAILNEQATELERMTKGLLIGRVIKKQEGEAFYLRLSVIAPALNNYEYSIVDIEQKITPIYPVNIKICHLSETPDTFGVTMSDQLNGINCETYEDFKNTLQKILTSEPVRKAISGLLTQIHSA